MKFIDILKLLGPMLALSIPGGEKYSGLIMAGISLAEETAKSGKDKKQIAIDSVRVGAEASNLIAGHTIVDPNKAVVVAENTIDSIVELVNTNLDIAEGVQVENVKPIPDFDNLLGSKK